MLRLKNLLLVFGAFLTVAGSARLAHANTCSFGQGGAEEFCLPIGTVDNGPFFPPFTPPVSLTSDGTGSFQLPQFDPRLGQLQDVVLNVNILGETGTLSYIYTGIPQTCVDEGFPAGCGDLAWEVRDESVLVTSGSFYSQSAGRDIGLDVDAGLGCLSPCAMPGGGPWQTDADLTGGFGGMFYDAAHASPFVGTGQVTFNVTAGAQPVLEGPGTLTGFSVDSVDYEANVTYDFTPAPVSAVPEPSLLALTGGLLGLVVAGKRIVAK